MRNSFFNDTTDLFCYIHTLFASGTSHLREINVIWCFFSELYTLLYWFMRHLQYSSLTNVSIASDFCAFCWKFNVLKCVIRLLMILLSSLGNSIHCLRHFWYKCTLVLVSWTICVVLHWCMRHLQYILLTNVSSFVSDSLFVLTCVISWYYWPLLILSYTICVIWY
jgi:hypothetical protein